MRIEALEKPEIDLPAGSLQCALYAFKGGADAVYLGMKSFSARAGAVNFSFEDLRKLKYECLKQNKKFYIAFNTLVRDEELPEVINLLKELEYLQPDGVILQDLGVVNLLKKYFPSLELHTSTQLAVHTAQGVKAMADMGFSRVVLSRELSFEEIKDIREKCPDIQLKIFIHGAMCYGFSGLCMASQQITGRSANEGACAQICRTWFKCNETKEDKWFFSMKDMNIGTRIRNYAKIGVDSFKIEGRMKGPEYVYHAARYYRLLADGADENSQPVLEEKEALKTSFERLSCPGFFETKHNGSTNCENLICSDYPSHRGLYVGTIDKIMGSKALIKFSEPVALRDGLLVIYENQSCGFALKEIEGGKSFVSAGESAVVNFPANEFNKRPCFGTPVYCVSRHNGTLPLISENIPLYKKPVDLDVVIENNGIILNGDYYSADVQEAKTQNDIFSAFEKTFSSSDKSLFTLGKLTLKNNTPWENVFIPLSVLKQTRRIYYQKLDDVFDNRTFSVPAVSELPTLNLPKRSELGLWDEIVEIQGKQYLPLSPVMFNEDSYLQKLDNLVAENPSLIIGLNNIAHIMWAEKHPETEVFADIFLYTSNTMAWQMLKDRLPNLKGSYELKNILPFTYAGGNFNVPLFISRVCFRHNSLGKDCKSCSRDNTYHLEQNSKLYTVRCKDCITTVTKS